MVKVGLDVIWRHIFCQTLFAAIVEEHPCGLQTGLNRIRGPCLNQNPVTQTLGAEMQLGFRDLLPCRRQAMPVAGDLALQCRALALDLHPGVPPEDIGFREDRLQGLAGGGQQFRAQMPQPPLQQRRGHQLRGQIILPGFQQPATQPLLEAGALMPGTIREGRVEPGPNVFGPV